jgi:hypothetical protein
MIRIYTTKRLAIPMKIKCLSLLTRILKYRKYGLSIEIEWRPFWSEILDICTRSAKHKSIGCENLNSRLFENLIHFIHEARVYFSATAAEEVVQDAMSHLADLRHPMAFLGVEQLVLCLPTKYDHYDKLLPRWVDLMAQITDNDAWDCCWLTLLCRARKFTTIFDWAAIQPQLYVKVKELLQFPVSKGR